MLTLLEGFSSGYRRKFRPWIPIQFGYRIWPSSNEGINVRYLERYQIASPSRMSGSVPL